MGRHNKTAVVLIDCGFVSLMSATTIECGYETFTAKFERKACPVGSPKRKNKRDSF